jgi:hypothetical protein
MTNTQLVAALEPHPAAPDQECVPGNMTELAARLAALLSVVSVTSEIDQQSTNSIAQQALETANIALTTAQQAIASIPQTRTNGAPQDVAAGDSVLPLSWTVPMPNTNYEVRLTYYGANAAIAVFYAFRVVDGTRTVNGCSVRLDNTPSNTKVAWVVQQLPTA